VKRVLLVHHDLLPVGGGNLVGAWFLEALRERFRTTLLAWRRPDFAQVDRYYGTALAGAEFELRLVPAAARRAVDALPVPADYLRINVLARSARALLRREPHELAISTLNEMDFGQPALQYVHYPSRRMPRPEADYRWYSRVGWWLGPYRAFADRVGRGPGDVRRNVTLANSEWTAVRWRSWHGTEARVLYPPAVGPFPRRDWASRIDGFVCLGRISEDKEVGRAVEVVRRLRERGRPVRLCLVGAVDDRALLDRLLAAGSADDPASRWIEHRERLPRGELLELLASHRYLLHPKSDEHFGIAVAEALCCGCVPFVSADSGSAEIVGHDERLLFHDEMEAVAKIEALGADEPGLAAVRAALGERSERFASDRFVEGVRELVEESIGAR